MAKKEQKLEEMMKKLENIVVELEKEEIGLDKSIKLYDEGIKIAQECSKELNKVETKIKELINEKGRIKVEDFKEDE